MSDIFRTFFDQGFVLDGFEEPLIDPGRGTPGSPGNVYTEVPGVLVARMSLPGCVASHRRPGRARSSLPRVSGPRPTP
jgi:hypothetical protein